MWHGRIPERAHDVKQRVRVPVRRDVEQRLRVPATRRHVGELDGRRHPFLGLKERRQPIQALVRHARDADVRLGSCPGCVAPLWRS